MPKLLHELRERLLRAGVAPRHVRRYLAELTDHLADLRTEEGHAGRSAAEVESAALARLGNTDDLAKAMIEKRHFQSWCARAPWAMFGLAPALVLAAAWIVALFILWSGWYMFLPGAETPFGGHRVHGFANLYFQFGKAIYFYAPILVGWGIGILAIRQRMKTAWLAAGMLLLALAGSTAHVYAGRTAVPGGFPHVRMSFTVALVQGRPFGLLHMMILLSIAALPYVVWRIYQAYWRTT
jgi:hypothetical protein